MGLLSCLLSIEEEGKDNSCPSLASAWEELLVVTENLVPIGRLYALLKRLLRIEKGRLFLFERKRTRLLLWAATAHPPTDPSPLLLTREQSKEIDLFSSSFSPDRKWAPPGEECSSHMIPFYGKTDETLALLLIERSSLPVEELLVRLAPITEEGSSLFAETFRRGTDTSFFLGSSQQLHSSSEEGSSLPLQPLLVRCDFYIVLSLISPLMPEVPPERIFHELASFLAVFVGKDRELFCPSEGKVHLLLPSSHVDDPFLFLSFFSSLLQRAYSLPSPPPYFEVYIEQNADAGKPAM